MDWLKKALKQRNIGSLWGTIAQIAAQASIFISIINLLLLMVTAYNTTLAAWLIQYGIYLKFWVFVAVVLGSLFVSGILLWKFALPSYYAAFNEQFYKHNNALRTDVEEIKGLLKEENRSLRERVVMLERRISELEGK